MSMISVDEKRYVGKYNNNNDNVKFIAGFVKDIKHNGIAYVKSRQTIDNIFEYIERYAPGYKDKVVVDYDKEDRMYTCRWIGD